ncbi:prephenate dehydrogenase/arogenate dehydrogenase family protein [Salaquimonas pukyongi]|uniref:prephenate dehydrogenase/arogenate dehydrogenase family protein n=1 Tax=Salaquimonas pukyongi TaxID=2712698 RepID=UPI00096B9158|nr:prephenate dehydrogenase/arogenate dehydrogenase family protein [Salaquimonas pukyongi]
MRPVIGRLAIIGQGLIGSSITRAVYERKLARETVVTDASPKVRKRLLELGLGEARIVKTAAEAASGADMIIGCVPVRSFSQVVGEMAPVLKPGAILSDVGSVKQGVVAECLPIIPPGVHFVPAHPLAGTEFSGPDAGLPRLFVNRWCILTPPEGSEETAIDSTRRFWEAMGSRVEVMSPARHDMALAITSHVPHLAAFSIFHTALAQEDKDHSPVIQFSAGAFKDFTRIASSNPVMWRDIFLMNREPVLEALRSFITDMEACARAIEEGDGDTLEKLFSVSRSTRRKVIEKEHISQQPDEPDDALKDTLFRPYSQDN